MTIPKYKLIEISTGKCVTYSDTNTTVFGGPWGDQTQYQWVENVLTEDEIRENKIKQLIDDYKPYLDELALLYSKALIQEEAQTAQDLKDEYNFVLQCYQDELSAL